MRKRRQSANMPQRDSLLMGEKKGMVCRVLNLCQATAGTIVRSCQ